MDEPTLEEVLEDYEMHARLILHAAMKMWDSCLVGNAAPKTQALYERMIHPAPGDWVYERSTSFMLPPNFSKYPALNKVGVLIKQVHEPVPVAEECRDQYDVIPEERVWYIRTLDGREYRWTNADMLAFNWEDK